MAIALNIRATGARDLLKSLNRFDSRIAQRATQQALNRTINNMAKAGKEEGAKFLGVAKSKISKGARVDQNSKHGAIAIQGARRGKAMRALMFVRGKPFNLIRWTTTPTKGGVISNAWGSAKRYPDTAIIGGKFVAVLTKHKDKRGRAALRNKSAWGPGMTHAMEDPKIVAAILDEGDRKFVKHFASAAAFLLEREGYKSAAGNLRTARDAL